MRRRRFQPGARAPDLWNAPGAINGAIERVETNRQSQSLRDTAVDLLGPLWDPLAWPVRDQGFRGTCNAFAVVAAEELANRLQSGRLVTLSEEYLYAAMRKVTLGNIAVEPDKIEESGATFLFQAKSVIENGHLHRPDGLAYDMSKSLPPNHVIGKTPSDSAKVPGATRYLHNIAKTPDLSDTVEWADPTHHDQETVTQLFASRLEAGVPVVAAFPVFASGGPDTFTGPNAEVRGLIRYPQVLNPRTSKTTVGHSVCIVGHVGGRDGSPDGWFVFRNSLGVARCADYGERVDRALRVRERGYGLISTLDVERYCWEYLCRA